ncbi:MAG: DUF4249 domain-containing protein [Saprospiraceae bacterium]|nr:DUF4249 domain-containing protein [Saprospiraceae bacterium]
MKLQFVFYIISFLFFGLISCEEEVVHDNSNFTPQYVIESYIEKSGNAFPPYLLLTKSIGFYSKIDLSVLNNLFVSGAKVSILLGNNKYELDEVCLSQLPSEIRKEILINIGLNPDSVSIDFCAYIDVNRRLPIQLNTRYELEIVINTDTIKSYTTIPDFNPIDTFWFADVPGLVNDSFAQLFGRIKDLPTQVDYYRYFTAGQGESIIPDIVSVFDDFFFNGQNFKFTIPKARAPGEEFTDISGYFRRGDTIKIKWCNIDKAHYDFWNTLEVSRTRQGPFSNYIRIKGNIVNGLGIFGGQQCETYTLVVIE